MKQYNIINKTIDHTRWKWLREIEKDLKYSKTILDIGCSYNSSLSLLFDKKTIFGIEADKNYYEQALKNPLYKDVYHGDATKIIDSFEYDKYDACVMIHFIEHITKEQAHELIEKLKKICNRIVILTPKGFIEQEEQLVEDSDWQIHKSGWTTQDFDDLGFQKTIEVWNEPITSVYAVWFKEEI